MKKLFFLFSMLTSITASAIATVTPISADYANQKVTFKVEWNSAPYNNRVWIWIDFCSICDITPGSFSPATITGATITSGSGSINGLTGRGFFITGSTTNSGTTITATLHPVPAEKFNWCAYGSDYPPNATMNNGTYTLKGSSPFIINGTTTLGAGVKSFSGTCITALTDATGCPGVINNNFTPGSITTASYYTCINVAGTATSVATAPTGSGNYAYQWTVSYNTGTASTISGATAANYTPPATATAGTYRYMRQVKDNLCATAYTNSTGTVTRTVYTSLTIGAINSSSTFVRTGVIPAAITSNTNASSGGGVTYRWVRTGTSNATYTGNTAGHSFSAAEVNTAGTWTYYREVRDNTCNTTTWSRSSGSYKLTVITCPYTGSDLYIDATHLCQQRTSGAKNWEAYIKDSRDNQIYRITQFSDNTWWFADDLAIAGKSVATCNGKKYYDGANQPSCPSGWNIPNRDQHVNRWTKFLTDDYGAPLTDGDYYAQTGTVGYTVGCGSADRPRVDLVCAGCVNTLMWKHFYTGWGWNFNVPCTSNTRIGGRVRCMR
jgi:hypothetical protein